MTPRLVQGTTQHRTGPLWRERLLEKRRGLPGVFALGDVRSGSMKRVASAVGEGAAAVALVHRILREQGTAPG